VDPQGLTDFVPGTPPAIPGEPSYVLELRTGATVREAWDVLSDTRRVNRAAGLLPFEYADHPQPDGTSRRSFRTKIKHLLAEGEEFTATWESPRMFDIRRSYHRGPFHAAIHRVEIEADGDGSVVRSSMWMVPRGLVGRIFTWGFGREVLPAMRTYLERRLAGDDVDQTFDALPAVALSPLEEHKATPTQVGKVDALVRRAGDVFESEILEHLGHLVLRGPDDLVERIRPLALARAWGTPSRETVDACLAATSVGLLKLRWDLICPHCRGDKNNLGSLGEVPTEGWCASCNLRFEVDLDKVLEVVFEPAPDIRKITPGAYCQAGPGTTPHVRYQKLLAPGEEWVPKVDVEPGRYRVRVSGTDSVWWLRVQDDAEPIQTLPTIDVTDEGLRGDEPVLPPGQPTPVTLRNLSGRTVVAVIEDARWAADALAGCELVADQRFRDLFSDQMLSGGVALAVQSVTILFTDLVGSTAMYTDLGDAKAFRLVWNHFEILTDIVRNSRGATVKTIGDAVMAAFVHPDDALRAAHELHERLSSDLEEKGHDYPVALKIGLHEGPCIVVTLNDKLDYFGQTVNTAARVEGCSEGGDIVVSRHFASLSEGCEVLRDLDWFAEPFEKQLKGLEHPLAMLRFKRFD